MDRTTVTQLSSESTPRRTISINSDLGESFGLHSFGNDAALLETIDVANVACGFHSGDPETMAQTVELAYQKNVKIGAHPGLPDLVGFGRREMKLTASEVESLLLYQVGALNAFLRRTGAELNHLKPHGSLYGMLARNAELMTAAAKVCELFQVPFFGLAGTEHQKVCTELGIPFIAELYVDLNYGSEGQLLIKRRPEPTNPEAAAQRVRRALEEGVVLAEDGTELRLDFDSICVHSDANNSPAVALAVRDALR
ncbi:UPF0271 protein [Psychromicrobium silvestre]|uniref:UPF0271 protein n=1 Tax=Psychromicrobium silvestre TaxID=1645614 RepID=A0A7Y9LRF3_9MICC|nr:5-oxoprolinase subunit PxpA [Psychromicrobium silvestre]NYE94208.1 UPF0271 protein [Psychromicrobium silvestre]